MAAGPGRPEARRRRYDRDPASAQAPLHGFRHDRTPPAAHLRCRDPMSRRCHHGSAGSGRRPRPMLRERPRAGFPLDRPFPGPLGAPPPLYSDDQSPQGRGSRSDDRSDSLPHDARDPEIVPSLPQAPAPARSEPLPAEPLPAEPGPRESLPPEGPIPGSGWSLAPARPELVASAPDGDAGDRGATAPQLRRFIKSRAYVPMHELRRRFGIDGGDDDVTPVSLERQVVYVGLPNREGTLLGELLRAGDIGYELSFDPVAPIVVGVYPMRPIPRG
jgi:hypothetical protein